MAVHRPDHLVGIGHALDQLPHGFGILPGDVVADGIGHVDRRCAGLDDFVKNPNQEVEFRTPGILGRELDVARILARPADRPNRLFDHLVGCHSQLLFHVDGRSGNEGVDAAGIRRPDRLARTPDVVLIGTCERADRRLLDGLGNRLDGFVISLSLIHI